MAKYTNISKKKWLEREKKGLVSFGSKDQDTFELDHDNERGERRMEVDYELDEHRKQKKSLDAITADGIYTPKHAPVKHELQDKLHDFRHRINDHVNRGRKTNKHSRHISSSSSSYDSSLRSSSSSSSEDDTHEHRHRRHKHKSRSPTAKMNTFRGDGTISWDTFIIQFERLAERKDWKKRKRTDKLLNCLEGSA